MTNVKRIRERQGMSFAGLARRLELLGRPIAPLGLRRIETGDRRVDADDLVALAAALRVSPVALLNPDAEDDQDPVEVTGVGTVPAHRAYDWLVGQPLPGTSDSDYWMSMLLSAPTWEVKQWPAGTIGGHAREVTNGND